MSTDVETDTAALEALDFEVLCEAIQCLVGEVACSKTARWIGRQPCCGSTFLTCDAYRAHIEQFRSSLFGWHCVRCGALRPPGVTTTFTPIPAVTP